MLIYSESNYFGEIGDWVVVLARKRLDDMLAERNFRIFELVFGDPDKVRLTSHLFFHVGGFD